MMSEPRSARARGRATAGISTDRSGWRTLTWPKASQTFSAERMRFAMTSSSTSVFKSGMTPPSKCVFVAATILDRTCLAVFRASTCRIVLVDQSDTIEAQLDAARALEIGRPRGGGDRPAAPRRRKQQRCCPCRAREASPDPSARLRGRGTERARRGGARRQWGIRASPGSVHRRRRGLSAELAGRFCGAPTRRRAQVAPRAARDRVPYQRIREGTRDYRTSTFRDGCQAPPAHLISAGAAHFRCQEFCLAQDVRLADRACTTAIEGRANL